jgi:CelD/BcsL family acetyltransferase involved in cellulose biosynthesis
MSGAVSQPLPAEADFCAPAVIDGVGSDFWDNLACHPRSLFASRPWIEAVASTYGFTVSASACMTGGKVAAALIYSQVADIRGERIVSFPFSDFCDPVVSGTSEWHDLVAPVVGRGIPVNLRCLRNHVPAADPRFRPVGRVAWHGTDLTRSEDVLWAGLGSTARNAIRKARSRGLVVRAGKSLDDLRKFYAMHCYVRKSKYRLLPQPFALFERLYAAFAPGDYLTVLLAEEDGVPVAGTLFLEWADTLYYKFNASLDRTASPNDLVIWEGIRLGQHRGLKLLDYGASDLDQPGLLRFKRKYATQEREIVRYRCEPVGYADARGREADRLLGGLTQLLTDPAVPEAITQAAGDQLYGLFC